MWIIDIYIYINVLWYVSSVDYKHTQKRNSRNKSRLHQTGRNYTGNVAPLTTLFVYFHFLVLQALCFLSTPWGSTGVFCPFSASTFVSSPTTEQSKVSWKCNTYIILHTSGLRWYLFCKGKHIFPKKKNPVPSLHVNTIFVVVCLTENIRINVDNIIHKLNWHYNQTRRK